MQNNLILDQLSKMFGEGNDFSLTFLKDPLKFCESNKFEVYKNKRMGTYNLIYKINENSFYFMDIKDGCFISMALDENGIKRLIDSSDQLTRVDNEIFMIWLKDNLDIFEKEYKKLSCPEIVEN